MAAVVSVGVLLFGIGFRERLITPSGKEAYVLVGEGRERRLSEDYPGLNAVVYSLDIFIRLVDLHQASYWLPNANRPWGGALLSYFWFQIVSGWVLTTLLVVGLIGLIRHEGG